MKALIGLIDQEATAVASRGMLWVVPQTRAAADQLATAMGGSFGRPIDRPGGARVLVTTNPDFHRRLWEDRNGSPPDVALIIAVNG